MSLQEQLAEISAAGAKRIPEEARKTMGAATQALRESGIMEKTIKVGDKLPPFTLKNAHGEDVSSADLLAKGTVVLTVFRGHW
jgi:cytochrome oxidase Cu insertion factor (SCO1/SenC/PrrC family)